MTLRKRFHCLFLLAVSTSIVESSTFIPLSLGPDFQSPYSEGDILRGFKLNIAEGESPLRQHAFEGDVRAIPFSTTFTKSAVIKSLDELKDMMEIQGSLSVSYGPMISGEGSGRFLQDKVQSKRQISILYRTRRVAYAKAVDVRTLQPIPGLEELTGDGIAEAYGSKFIDQVVYGAQLDVIFTLTSSEDIDLQEIEAELKGKIGVGPLSIGFQAKFEKQQGHSRSELEMSIVAQASGVDFFPPANPSFDDTNEIIDDFNSKYNELTSAVGQDETVDVQQNVLKQLSPVGFTLASIADYLTKLNGIESAALDSRMEELREVFYHSLLWKSRIKSTRDQLQQDPRYVGPRSRDEIFEPYDVEVGNVVAELDKKIEECLVYRRQPMAVLVGRAGSEAARVPDKYPFTAEEKDVAQGLVGEAYIPSPVTIGDTTFDGIHYVGFAIPKGPTISHAEASLTTSTTMPWMMGALVRDDNDSEVATADTPEELELIAYGKIHGIVPEEPEYIRHGDTIFLQTSGTERRWLKVASVNVNMVPFFLGMDPIWAHVVSTANMFENGQKHESYSWKIHSGHSGECLRYGDKILLESDSAWLQGGIPPSDKASHADGTVQGSEPSALGSDLASHTWIVRSTFGSGSRSSDNNPDPAQGECIQSLSKVYLQVNNYDNRWLCGGRGTGNQYVDTRNVYRDDYELQHPYPYEWVLRPTPGDGSLSDGFFCSATSAKGRWVPLSPNSTNSSEEVQTVSVETGVFRTTESLYWKHTETWEESVVGIVGQGIGFGPDNLESGCLAAAEIAPTVRNALSSDSSTASSESFGAGQVWQFVYEMSDICTSSWELKTQDLVLTNSANEPPCCLPGFEADPKQPHGRCRLQSACQCDKSICDPTPPPSVSPTTTSPTTTSPTTTSPLRSPTEAPVADTSTNPLTDTNTSSGSSTHCWQYCSLVLPLLLFVVL